ncbi:hypothetical protein GCM10010965_28840 [Caldalkalibacillus thermarum]|uniref:DUF354 domain-containing protein n=1 Tax=Caldalkalibacillus thermarum TaxID=296745 RepID=UPI00166BE482|nr:DUF354 domain-containing protein [Caldalkalibacillus thermarum]GGK34155.1 hypothetical protein GCM10010965_28840 [Caldalkalibacillus thermarum]
MNIGFIVSNNKTIFFYQVAKKLESYGYKTWWLSPNKYWAKWLQDHGVPKERILDITDFGQEWESKYKLGLNERDSHDLHELEKDYTLNINNLILMDRLLSRKEYEYALSYLLVCNKYIEKFLLENNIQVVFYEATWAIELLTVMICNKIGIIACSPHTVRIPDGRFAFFDGYLQSEIIHIRNPDDKDRVQAKKYYKEFLNKKPKPKYWYLNNKTPSLKFSWFIKLYKHIILSLKGQNKFDETYFGIKWLIKNRIREVKNAWLLKVKNPFEQPNLDEPYILFTLHKQPEASVDVLGSYYSNQIETIKLISRITPVTHKVYVKEHSNAIGDRSISYYNEIKRIPGVKLIHPSLDSHDLIRNADLVITISGTVAYEASLYGVPAVTLSSMFYKDILTVNQAEIQKLNITDIIENKGQRLKIGDNIINFLAYIYANSFEGIISDPVSDPSCISEENISKTVKGFRSLLDKLTY